MRVYVETGILIDYLAQAPFAALRPAQRRGRSPRQLYNDAHAVLELISTSHEGAVSAFSFYEVEEALYALVSRAIKGVPNVQAIRLAATRPILIQALYFASQGVRVADGLHLMMAAEYDADLLLSADRDILRLNGQILNQGGRLMRCDDTNAGLSLLRSISN